MYRVSGFMLVLNWADITVTFVSPYTLKNSKLYTVIVYLLIYAYIDSNLRIILLNIYSLSTWVWKPQEQIHYPHYSNCFGIPQTYPFKRGCPEKYGLWTWKKKEISVNKFKYTGSSNNTMETFQLHHPDIKQFLSFVCIQRK